MRGRVQHGPGIFTSMYLSKEAVDAFGEKLDPGGRVSLSRQQLSELCEATDVSHHHCALESIHARY